MTRSLHLLTPVALVLALAGTSQAQTLVGAGAPINNQATLYVIDPVTGATTPFMTVAMPAGHELYYLASASNCRLFASTYANSASIPSRFAVIDPAAGTYNFQLYGAPLATSYCEGVDWSPRHNAYLIGFGTLGNFATRRLALIDINGAVLNTSGTLTQSDTDEIASDATRDLIFDLNSTSTPRVFNVTTPFPTPVVSGFASPPSITNFKDATIHPTTGKILFSDSDTGRLIELVGNTYVNGPIVQGVSLRGLTWCTLPPVNVSVPPDVIVCPGGTATITVTHLGTGPFTYQWRVNDSPINPLDNASAITSSLVITNADLEDVGDYTCVISGPCASVTTDVATLRVCAGDFNCDGFVNGDDYDAFASLFESGDLGGDFNDDGFVNGDDYDSFASAFENGC
ncbi:MAG: immunoglobulin domain-containing protein [Phycisphaerales bacterium]